MTKSVSDQLRQALLTERGLTVTELARRLEMCRPAVSNVLNDSAALSIPLALKIEALFGLSARELLTAQLDRDIEEARANA